MIGRLRSFGDSLFNQFERLNEHEKRLILVGIGSVFLFVLGGSLLWFNQSVGKKRTEIEAIHKRLDEIILLEDEYRVAKAKQEAEERRFQSNNLSLFSLIQNAANRYGLTLYDLNEKKEPVAESRLIEISVVVNLKELSLDRMTAFLEELENSSEKGLVKVTRLKVKTRYDTPELLDVQMTVTTWKTS